MKKSVINAYSNYRTHLSNKKEQAERKKEEKLNISIQKLKLEKAKRLTQLFKLKNRILNKETKKSGQKKKNTDTSASASGRQWKQIKINQ